MRYEPSNKAYNEMVENLTPKSNRVKNCMWAFLIGGAICTLGQVICNLFLNADFEYKDASSYTSIVLVAISVMLTCLNCYKPIAKYGGAGTLVPITGFANSVCSPIVEFQTEGEVFGKGVKAFTIAGPVIMYGIIVSFATGLIYYFIK